MHHKDASVEETYSINDSPNVGQGEETLKGYNLTPQKVIRAAERTQNIRKGYQPRKLEDITKLIEDSIVSWDGSLGSAMDQLR